MEELNLMETFHDIIEESIEFLYEEYRLKYFDLFFITAKNIMSGEIVCELSDDKKEALNKIYEPIWEIDLDVESIRKALQAIILKGFQEEKLSNGGVSPDTIGMMYSYLISKFEPKKRTINVLDPLAGTGNLLFTVVNHLDMDINAYAVEHNERLVNIMKTCSDLMDTNVNIYLQNTLNTYMSDIDYLICDFDKDELKNGVYFPYEVIKHYLNAMSADGVMMCLIPNDFFSFDSNQEFKKSIIDEASIIGLIELPDTMSKVSPKSIILIQKHKYEDKKCLMVKLPSFSDSNAFESTLNQIEVWFENNIKNKKNK